MNQKAEWLNRKGFSKTPTVDDGAGQASCKTEDAEKLWSYWDQFWKKPIIRGACTKSSRPNLALFKMRIKSVKGCPGADGWSREEIMADIAAKLVWDSMQIWEQFGLSPTPLAHCKMGMIPKKDSRAVWPLEEDEKMDYFGLYVCDVPLCPASGLPQGDPLSPLVLVAVVHALQLIVETRVGDPNLRHFIYMDDRTAVASSKLVVKETQLAWCDVAAEYHLLENADKAQFFDISRRKDSFEVLVLKTQRFARANRLSKASELYRKIRFLPESYAQRMKDVKIIGGGIIGYGWISHSPSPQKMKAHLTALCRSLGRTQFSAVEMRKIIAGASLHLSINVLRRQMRLLQQRNVAIQEMYSVDILSTQMTSLEQMVTQGLCDLDWHKDERFGKWTHPLSSSGFYLEDVLDEKKWKIISHDLRESYRCQAFELFRNSSRHEIAGQDIGAYDPARRKLAVDWAKKDTLANLLLLGAVQSPLLRSKNRNGVQSVCPKCMMENPHWDHLWECFVGVVPADVLLRRFYWPRFKEDLPLCAAFAEGMRSFQ